MYITRHGLVNNYDDWKRIMARAKDDLLVRRRLFLLSRLNLVSGAKTLSGVPAAHRI
jgi:hypothetical protein